LFWRSSFEGLGKGFETRGFVKAVGFSIEEGSAKSLAAEEGGGLVCRRFLWKRNTKEKPSLLIGVIFEEFAEDGVRSPRLDGFRAVGAGELS
jgi:hypothetical protein